MGSVHIYLNFVRNTEQAFNFYKKVFGTEFSGPIGRFGDIPASPEMPPLSDEDKNLVMHVSLPLMGGLILMGTDAPESMGFKVVMGNNVHISLSPDTRAETEALFNALAEGGKVQQPLGDMFWGAYYGSLCDQFGVYWMFNCEERKATA